jgi:four helix bundle protein
MPVRDFRDLIVWQRAVDLAVEAYTLTRRFPPEERFGLTAQLRRAAISVSSNIAEGNGRNATKDYVRFLAIAKGSVNEVRSLLAVCNRLKLTTAGEVSSIEAMLDEVSKMLAALRASLLRNPRPAVR